jgi:hypothetical protein
MMQEQPQSFEYASAPQAVGTKLKRPKYRTDETDALALGSNIMYDRRVVRGNTYGAQVVTQNASRELDRLRSENERALKREVARRRLESGARPTTPPPVSGRQHMDTMTDTYLEELSDRAVEVDAHTQTEAALDRPPSPLFVAAKSGADVGCQVDVDEIFDFDAECAPLLEVLVGKTLQTAMLEVMEEEELAAIRRRQDQFEVTSAHCAGQYPSDCFGTPLTCGVCEKGPSFFHARPRSPKSHICFLAACHRRSATRSCWKCNGSKPKPRASSPKRSAGWPKSSSANGSRRTSRKKWPPEASRSTTWRR